MGVCKEQGGYKCATKLTLWRNMACNVPLISSFSSLVRASISNSADNCVTICALRCEGSVCCSGGCV